MPIGPVNSTALLDLSAKLALQNTSILVREIFELTFEWLQEKNQLAVIIDVSFGIHGTPPVVILQVSHEATYPHIGVLAHKALVRDASLL